MVGRHIIGAYGRCMPVVTEGPELRVDVHVGKVDVLEACDGAGVLALAYLRYWEEPRVLVLYNHHFGGILTDEAGWRACPIVPKACHHDEMVIVNAFKVCCHVIHPVLQRQADVCALTSKFGHVICTCGH